MDSTRSVTGSCAGALQRDRAVPAVRFVQELPDHLAHVQRVRRTLAALALLFDPADHARVEAETGAEGEPAGRDRLVLGARGAGREAQADRALALRRAARPAGRRSPPPRRWAGRGRGRRHWWSRRGPRRGSGRRSGSGPLCSRPFTTSLTVPSPPRATTSSMSSVSAACRPRSRACPRYSVVTASSFISLASAWIEHVTRPRTGGGCCWIDHEKCTHDGQTYLPRGIGLKSLPVAVTFGDGPGAVGCTAALRSGPRRRFRGAGMPTCRGEYSAEHAALVAHGRADDAGQDRRSRPDSPPSKGLALAVGGVYMLVMGLARPAGQSGSRPRRAASH